MGTLLARCRGACSKANPYHFQPSQNSLMAGLLPSRRTCGASAKALSSQAGKEVERKGQNHADQDRGPQRKVKREVLAAVRNITGEMANRYVPAPQGNEDQAHYNQQCAEHNDEFPNLRHPFSLRCRPAWSTNVTFLIARRFAASKARVSGGEACQKRLSRHPGCLA